jgi:cytochrome P450
MTQETVHTGQTNESAATLRALLSRPGRLDPVPHYADLHRRGPVCVLPDPVDRFDVVVHGYDAVQQALRDPALHVLTADSPDRRGSRRWQDHPALRTLVRSIFLTEGPEHTRVRRLFAKAFTARRMAALEPAIVRIISQRLDRLAELGANGEPVDLLAEFALPVPTDAVGELLGVPEQDRGWFPDRVRAFGAILDLGAGVWRHQRAADAAAEELTGYFTELVAKRRAQPREDLVSALVHGGDELADDDLIPNLLTLYNGGFVTTTHLIGNGLVLLLDRPEEIPAIQSDPRRADAFVQEVLRYEPPVHFGIRWASRETEIAGARVPADSRVLVLLGAANRDPRQFPDPDVFDPVRDQGQPMSFGLGAHYCLGAMLSRLEGRWALPMLLRRFPRLALAGEPGERSTLMLRGYETLPVTLS